MISSLKEGGGLMIKALRFAAGFLVGWLVAFALIYLVGSGAESMGIRWFDSESDQQRNFNIVMLVCALFGVVSGVYLARRPAKD